MQGFGGDKSSVGGRILYACEVKVVTYVAYRDNGDDGQCVCSCTLLVIAKRQTNSITKRGLLLNIYTLGGTSLFSRIMTQSMKNSLELVTAAATLRLTTAFSGFEGMPT